MSTSLAEQLQRLAVPQTSTLKQNDKKRASILFDVKEAANISKETIFQIGSDGFEELVSKNPIFSTFETTLFHNTGKHFERAVQTTEANAKLDKNIRRFFHLLSPYFLMNAAHKALEWLVYRYQIHAYNRDELILLILPYHDTNIFVRVLQIIEIKDNDKWLWLKPLQKPGVHLSKHVLYNHAASNPGFIQLLSDNLIAAIKEHEKPSFLTVAFNFYCATFTGALENSKVVDEPLIVQMLPSIVKGLKSEIPDFCAAVYIILAKLLTKSTLSEKVLDLLMEKLTEINVSMLNTEAILVMIVLYQSHENYKTMPSEAVKNLSEKDWLPNLIRDLGENGCLVNTILIPMFRSSIEIAINEVSTTFGKRFVDLMLNALKFDEVIIHEVFNSLTIYYDTTTNYPLETTEWLKKTMETLERQYPESYDHEVSNLMKQSSDDTLNLNIQRRNFQHILQNLNMHSQSELFGKLYHPQPHIRKTAIKKLLKKFTSLKTREKDCMQSAIVDRLHDDNKDVMFETLQMTGKLLHKLFEPEELKKILLKLLYRNKFESFSKHILIELLKIEGVHDDYEILIGILPYFFPHNEGIMKITKFLIEEYVSKSSLLEPLKTCNVTSKNYKEVVSIVDKQMKYIKLDENKLLQIVETSLNNQHCEFKYATTYLFCKTATVFNPKVLPLLIEQLNCAQWSFASSESQYFNCAYKQLPIQGYVQCIEAFINKCPKSTVSMDCYDFLSNDDLTKMYLVLTNFLLNGVFHCKTSYVTMFASSFKKFLEHFASHVEIEFLLNYAACDNPTVTSASKLRALKSACELFNTKYALTNENVIVPYLIVCLQSEHEEIRKVAINCFEKLSIDKSDYKNLVSVIYKGRNEIIQDADQLPLVIANGKSKCSAGIIALATKLTKNVPIYLKSGIILSFKLLDDVELYKMQLTFALSIINDKSYHLLALKIIMACIEQFTEQMASATTVYSVLWNFINAIMKDEITTTSSDNNEATPCIAMLNKIDREMFSHFSSEVQIRLLDLIVQMTTYSTNPEMLPAAARVFKHIDLSAMNILDLLHKMRDVQSPKVQTKMRRRVSVVPTVDILDTNEWKKGITVLEFIQDKKKMRNVEKLIPVLFDILKKCLDFDEQANVEYPKQLVLSSILHYCDKIDPTQLPENVFNMELVVQCIRASQNPQTHHHALLLLAKVASFIPNQVLLHIMAIFTFMGSSVLRHDDAYSFQIISKIIETIIPILVKEKSKADIVSVLRVFVDVIVDVPEHRRMPLYSQLLQQIGPQENLYVFLILIFEAHVLSKNKTSTKYLDIAKALCFEFSPEVVIVSCIQLIDYVKSLPIDKEDYRSGDFIFDVKNNTPKQFRHLKYTLIVFTSNLLSSKEFVNNVAKLDDDANEKLEEIYKKMIVNILTYIQTTSKVAEVNVNTPQSQYWKVMLHHAYDILDSLNALLTSQMFLLVIKGLMTHQLNTVKRRALELLNSKLQHNQDFFKDCERSDLYAIIPPLIDIIKQVENESLDSDEEIIIQTALLSLKLLCRLLASENPTKFVQILNFITEFIKTKIDSNILASAVLCLAELCTHLRSHAITGLNKFMPSIIKILKSQSKEEYPTLLLLSTITTLQKILDVLALFISPYLEKLLCEICNLTAKFNSIQDSKTAPFINKIENIREKFGASIPPRVLIPAIDTTYEVLNQKENFNAIGPLMNILSQSLTHLKGPEIQSNIQDLTTFFLHALEFRTKQTHADNENIILVETHVIQALTNLILKLSESNFRPLYYKLYDWAIRTDEKSEKIIVFYKLSAAIANNLKGLFVLFAGHFLNNSAQVLDSCNVKSEKLYFREEHKNIQLLENVLKTVNFVCLYDTQKFINKERFDILMQPIVDQLDNTLGDYEQRVREIVIPTVVNFTVAAADDALWKQLNYQILLKMRDANPKIRMLALECLRDVCHKVGEDFLPLLPETIPFLAELLEDEEEDIEKACQKTIQELEKVLGESLGKYF